MHGAQGQVVAELLLIARTPVVPLSRTEPRLHRGPETQDRGRALIRAAGPALGREWGNSWHSPLALLYVPSESGIKAAPRW